MLGSRESQLSMCGVLALCGFVTALFTGCITKPNPLYCDENTPCPTAEKSFCDIDAVFPDTDLLNTCIPSPAEDACNIATPCPANKPVCTDLSNGVCVECDDTSPCTDENEECNLASSTCVPRSCEAGTKEGNADCAARETGEPFCSRDGECVECLESADCTNAAASVCDPENFSCRGCFADNDCESGFCLDVAGGMCAPEDEIVYVSETGLLNQECGSKEMPCARIDQALDFVNVQRNKMVVAAGSYGAPFNISTSLTLVSLPGAIIETSQPIRVINNSVVEMRGLHLRPPGGTDGLQCNESTLVLRDSIVEGAPSTGVRAETGCELEIISSTIEDSGLRAINAEGTSLSVSESVIRNNEKGAIIVEAGTFDLFSNFIVYNGDSTSLDTLRFTSVANSFRFDHNTVVGNQADPNRDILDCDLPGSTNISGNIFYFNSNPAGAGTCVHNHSNVEGIDNLLEGVGQENIDADPRFVDNNPTDGDFHILSNSPCVDAADPRSDIVVDIDGASRPQGLRNDIGADEVSEGS